MTRTATFSGTILIVAGFVATSIAVEPDSTERRDRLDTRLAADDLANLMIGGAADTNAARVAIVANDDHTFSVELSPVR
ncbi:MAG: hypothetical protein LCH56_07330 [Proteobacteria bacterium]|nr:hypothetical protein [Pseudomonadota bacterium]